jgi:ubiquinone/menaquinone biosynthesis C-methylase UbiE
MTTPNFKKLVKRGYIIVLVLFATASLSCAQAPGNQSDVDWLIEVLDIEDGSTVADIGAGDGDQTLAISQHIGSEGTIYSTELGTQSVKELRQSIENTDFSNITVLEGRPDRTNLSKQCCDAIFLRRVYHHITNPKAFNSSLFASLKPGGRLAIIDFKPRGSEADPNGRASGSQHGVTAETVIKELRQAGFSLISAEEGVGRDIYVVMEKPSTNS